MNQVLSVSSLNKCHISHHFSLALGACMISLALKFSVAVAVVWWAHYPHSEHCILSDKQTCVLFIIHTFIQYQSYGQRMYIGAANTLGVLLAKP